MFFKRFKTEGAFKSHIKDYNDTLPYTAACYATYGYFYNGNIKDGGPLYFGFKADSKIEELVKELNSRYKNMKVNLITDYRKDSYYYFTVELNDKYSLIANYVITIAVAQFVRVFCTEYDHYKFYARKITQDFIKGAIEAFNDTCGIYGSWASSEIELEDFDKLDKVKFMNDALKNRCPSQGMPYNSNLLRDINRQSNVVEKAKANKLKERNEIT
jgi:hypothetical protein